MKARKGQDVTASRSRRAVGKTRWGAGFTVCVRARKPVIAGPRESCFRISRREKYKDLKCAPSEEEHCRDSGQHGWCALHDIKPLLPSAGRRPKASCPEANSP